MSQVEGKTLTCDLCGSSVFLKFTGHGEVDGGYSRWREYEKPPEGWNTAMVSKIGDLCPTCSRRINEVVEAEIRELSGGGGRCPTSTDSR